MYQLGRGSGVGQNRRLSTLEMTASAKTRTFGLKSEDRNMKSAEGIIDGISTARIASTALRIHPKDDFGVVDGSVTREKKLQPLNLSNTDRPPRTIIPLDSEEL